MKNFLVNYEAKSGGIVDSVDEPPYSSGIEEFRGFLVGSYLMESILANNPMAEDSPLATTFEGDFSWGFFFGACDFCSCLEKDFSYRMGQLVVACCYGGVFFVGKEFCFLHGDFLIHAVLYSFFLFVYKEIELWVKNF